MCSQHDTAVCRVQHLECLARTKLHVEHYMYLHTDRYLPKLELLQSRTCRYHAGRVLYHLKYSQSKVEHSYKAPGIAEKDRGIFSRHRLHR